MKRLITPIVFMLAIFCSCSTGSKETDAQEVGKNYFDFDKVEDLTVFFDSIESRHGIPTWNFDSVEYHNRVRQCVADLDDYRKNTDNVYPAREIKAVLFDMAWNIDCGEDHSGLLMSMEYFEWLLKLAAFYCPDVNLLSQETSDDVEAGLIDFSDAYDNLNPFVAYKLLKRDKGFEIISTGTKYDMEPPKRQ